MKQYGTLSQPLQNKLPTFAEKAAKNPKDLFRDLRFMYLYGPRVCGLCLSEALPKLETALAQIKENAALASSKLQLGELKLIPFIKKFFMSGRAVYFMCGYVAEYGYHGFRYPKIKDTFLEIMAPYFPDFCQIMMNPNLCIRDVILKRFIFKTLQEFDQRYASDKAPTVDAMLALMIFPTLLRKTPLFCSRGTLMN